MTVARLKHTATLLKNGKVLIVGGASGNPPNLTTTAEFYDPATGTFAATGSMATSREEQTATLLTDGNVLIAGGETPMGSTGLQATATAELYDVAQGSFSAARTMIASRNAHTATLLPNGVVLRAGGGTDSSTAEL
jgi:large repetitive protein